MSDRVVLAYSGGLDTSIIIPWLKENYGCEVIAFVADVGQGDDIEAVRNKAFATGASQVVVEDLREEFLREYVFPALKAGAVYEEKYLLGTSLARPVIAKHQVLCALREGATAVAHGCTGKGNDQVRFEHAFLALAPELKVIAPWREWNLTSREDCIDYAESRGVPVSASKTKIHSRDRNIWHLSHEGGELEDPNNAPLESTWQLTQSPQQAPDRAELVEIGFAEGVPVSVNGKALDPITLVGLLNEIGSRNAIGRIDLVENRFVGIKSRGCYETPGGTLLVAAHRELEAMCLDREVLHYKQHVALKYAELVYNGFWFTPLREVLDAFVNETQKEITGTITLSLYKGNLGYAGRQSKFSLYNTDLASFTMGDGYDQKDAAGFIRILAVPARARAKRNESLGVEGSGSMKMWSGRFRQPLDAEFENWQRSFPFDRRLVAQEVAASRAHARALHDAGVLNEPELKAVLGGLDTIARRAAGEPGYLEDADAEDVHHFVERELAAAIGETGLKLHTGRSRNEQIATDLRLFVRGAIDELRRSLANVIGELVQQAERAGDAAMPAYTHTQRAEPVLVAHWLLAYAEMFLRDADRLADCRERVNYCPLGSSAVAGATLALDRDRMAAELGFTAPTGQQHRRHQRPRLCPRVRAAPQPAGHSSQPLGGRDDFVFHPGVWFCPAAGGLLDRLQRHAAKEESRRLGTDPRPGGARHRGGNLAAGDYQGTAAWRTTRTCRKPRNPCLPLRTPCGRR